MEKITTRAIILRRVAYGEADWIVTFFSRDHGRMTGMAKAARKSIKRFGSGLEPGAMVQLMYTARPHSDLVRLEESAVIVPTTRIMRSYECIEAMSNAVRLALAFLKDHHPAHDKFDLLESYLIFIGTADPQPAMNYAFGLKWLALAGFEPLLSHCVGCGGEEEGDAAFSFNGGGMVCRNCTSTHHDLYPLSKHIRQSMVDLLRNPLDTALTPIDETAIAGLLERYTQYILG